MGGGGEGGERGWGRTGRASSHCASMYFWHSWSKKHKRSYNGQNKKTLAFSPQNERNCLTIFSTFSGAAWENKNKELNRESMLFTTQKMHQK